MNHVPEKTDRSPRATGIRKLLKNAAKNHPAREDIQRGWVRFGWLIYTDGFVLVGIPTDEPDDADVPKWVSNFAVWLGRVHVCDTDDHRYPVELKELKAWLKNFSYERDQIGARKKEFCYDFGPQMFDVTLVILAMQILYGGHKGGKSLLWYHHTNDPYKNPEMGHLDAGRFGAACIAPVRELDRPEAKK